MIKVRLHNDGKVELRERLSDDKAVLRAQVAKLTRLFGEENISVCRPAFAAGCETPSSVRMAIRAA